MDILNFKKTREIWNRCDICGKFISFEEFTNGDAYRVNILPDSDFSTETFKTLCKQHNNINYRN